MTTVTTAGECLRLFQKEYSRGEWNTSERHSCSCSLGSLGITSARREFPMRSMGTLMSLEALEMRKTWSVAIVRSMVPTQSGTMSRGSPGRLAAGELRLNRRVLQTNDSVKRLKPVVSIGKREAGDRRCRHHTMTTIRCPFDRLRRWRWATREKYTGAECLFAGCCSRR